MNVIDRHIRYLLNRHGSVAVPGIGVFVANQVSSAFVGNMLAAPSARYSFTPDEKCEAGQLVTSVARQLQISAVEAETLVKDEAAAWLHRLSLGLSIQIQGVGSLSLESAGSAIEFAPAEAPAMNWLKPLDLAPITISKADYVEADPEVEENRRRLMRSIARTASSAAAIAIMVLIAFIASQLPKSQDSTEMYATLPIEPLSSLSITRDGSLVERPAQKDHALVLILNTPSDGISDPTPALVVPEPVQPARYSLVVASLYSKGEAEKFIASKPADVELGIIENAGRYRVYASQGPTIDAVKADAEARKLYDRFPSGWICRN